MAGPEDKLFAFYTVRAGVAHGFERRIGMDRAEKDAGGELYVPAATSVPQWLPGAAGAPASGDTGWLPLNTGMQTIGSTSAENLQPRFAVDEDMRTWSQPADGDTLPALTSRLPAGATVRAVRIIWRDVALNTTKGVMPGPFRYHVELETARGTWTTILNRDDSQEDFLIDYRPCMGSMMRVPPADQQAIWQLICELRGYFFQPPPIAGTSRAIPPFLSRQPICRARPGNCGTPENS